MKLNTGKRIIMFFHWLFSVLICAAFTVYIVKPDWALGIYNGLTGNLTKTQVMIIGIAILALYVLLTVVQACTIFHRVKHGDRGFITVDSSDSGRVRIAITAIEQMVRQSIVNIDGITDMRINIENKDDAIGININTTLQNGCHVPTVTMNMQRAIRQFVEMNCGVAVRSVSININAVASAGEGGRRWGRRKDAKSADVPTPAYTPAKPEYSVPEEPVEEPAYTPILESEAAQEEDIPEDVSGFDEAPVYVEQEVDEVPVEGEPMAEDEPEPVAENEPEEVFIPDPKPIVLHFDHLPEQSDAASVEAPEAPETANDEQ